MVTATGHGSPGTALELGAPAYVVLGMVRLGARSGYEIKQTVEQSIRFFWTISQVQIYPSLQQLERAGLITGTDEPQGRRRRRVYEITSAGEEALRQWLRRAEPMPFELRDIGLVKLFFADALPYGEARELLGAIRRRSRERVATLRAIEPVADAAEEEGNLYPLLTLHMGIAFHQAVIDVCEDFERKLAGRSGARDLRVLARTTPARATAPPRRAGSRGRARFQRAALGSARPCGRYRSQPRVTRCAWRHVHDLHD